MSDKFKVPRKKRKETLVAYHDRLVALAKEADDAGDIAASRALQLKAGELAEKHKQIRERPRPRGSSGPGTYPWKQCIKDQKGRGYDQEGAQRVCGRIRASSKARYPDYWRTRTANPTAQGKPALALGLDAGPRHRPTRDMIVLFDDKGNVLSITDVRSEADLEAFSHLHPDVPIIGPLGVLSSAVRELRTQMAADDLTRKAPAR